MDSREKMSGRLQIVKRIGRFMRPYRGRICAMLVVIVVSGVVNIASPLILRVMIDSALPSRDLGRVIMLSLLLVLLPLSNGMLSAIQVRLNVRIGQGVIYDLRMALFRHLNRMSFRLYVDNRAGELISRVNNDVNGAQKAVSTGIATIVASIVQTVCLLGGIIALEWRMALICMLMFLLIITLSKRLGNKFRQIAHNNMNAIAEMNGYIHEALSIAGALLIKLSGRRHCEDVKFRERAEKVRCTEDQQAASGSIYCVIFGLVGAASSGIIYGMGGYLVVINVVTIGTIVACGAFMTQLFGPLQLLARIPVELAVAMASFERIFEILDLQVDMADKAGAVKVADVRGEISVEGVSFAYGGENGAHISGYHKGQYAAESRRGNDSASERRTSQGRNVQVMEHADCISSGREFPEGALEDVTFHVMPGQVVALVGPSGAGKTTMAYLIARVFDPSIGVIRIDGYDLRDIEIDSLSSVLGLVTQDTYLFHDTIGANLRYANEKASQSELEAAAKMANIHEFIVSLPNGYSTVVGEQGYRLSGGQKQRLALARMILKRPRILVLDEATSQLDGESEALVQEAIRKAMHGRTCIIIAHRMSTIIAADVILVMNKGRIVQRGRHEKLIKEKGLYRRLYEAQITALRDYWNVDRDFAIGK